MSGLIVALTPSGVHLHDIGPAPGLKQGIGLTQTDVAESLTMPTYMLDTHYSLTKGRYTAGDAPGGHPDTVPRGPLADIIRTPCPVAFGRGEAPKYGPTKVRPADLVRRLICTNYNTWDGTRGRPSGGRIGP
eukprot:Skav220243  [mRNA]  locus=scaffold3452:78723:79118:- [translate_table: standard]